MNLKPESNALKRPAEKSYENFPVVPAWVRRRGHVEEGTVTGPWCQGPCAGWELGDMCA